jgi:uncharacterized protein involved in exopolysaccharide biosynthesis
VPGLQAPAVRPEPALSCAPPPQVRQAQAQFEGLQRQCEAELSRVHKDLNSALEAMLHHRMAIRAALERAQGEVQQALAGLEGWAA